PARAAKRIACPLLVVVFDEDQTVGTAPAVNAAHRAPLGELARLPGDHYAAFEGAPGHARRRDRLPPAPPARARERGSAATGRGLTRSSVSCRIRAAATRPRSCGRACARSVAHRHTPRAPRRRRRPRGRWPTRSSLGSARPCRASRLTGWP